jgi:hypothetical protein
MSDSRDNIKDEKNRKRKQQKEEKSPSVDSTRTIGTFLTPRPRKRQSTPLELSPPVLPRHKRGVSISDVIQITLGVDAELSSKELMDKLYETYTALKEGAVQKEFRTLTRNEYETWPAFCFSGEEAVRKQQVMTMLYIYQEFPKFSRMLAEKNVGVASLNLPPRMDLIPIDPGMTDAYALSTLKATVPRIINKMDSLLQFDREENGKSYFKMLDVKTLSTITPGSNPGLAYAICQDKHVYTSPTNHIYVAHCEQGVFAAGDLVRAKVLEDNTFEIISINNSTGAYHRNYSTIPLDECRVVFSDNELKHEGDKNEKNVAPSLYELKKLGTEWKLFFKNENREIDIEKVAGLKEELSLYDKTPKNHWKQVIRKIEDHHLITHFDFVKYEKDEVQMKQLWSAMRIPSSAQKMDACSATQYEQAKNLLAKNSLPDFTPKSGFSR